MIEVTKRPIWIGAAVGPYNPVVFQRDDGFEPGHMCQQDGTLWISEVPYRCATLPDATSFARQLKLIVRQAAGRATDRP